MGLLWNHEGKKGAVYEKESQFALLQDWYSLVLGIFFISQAHAQAKKVTPMEGSNSIPLNLWLTTSGPTRARTSLSICGRGNDPGIRQVRWKRSSPSGKARRQDFYDALIRMEDISAIEAKFRDMK